MTYNLDDLVSGATTHLPLSKGIGLRAMTAGAHLGLALQINREALQARQLERVLERRFEQALVYDGCYVFANADEALVLWHSVAPVDRSLEEIFNRLLSLAGLDAVDRL